MNASSELHLRCAAQPRSVAPIRHALQAFLAALGFDGDALDDVTTAAGEALANAVEHAYGHAGADACDVELRARLDREKLTVDICDRGRFKHRAPIAGRGFGLRIIHAIAQESSVDISDGTRVRMLFNVPSRKS